MLPRRFLALAGIPALLLATACSSTDEKPSDPADPARIAKFESNPRTIREGERATLSWITEHVSAVRVVDGDGTAIDLGGASATSGSVEVAPVPGNGATFSLIATSERGGAALRRTITIGVVPLGGPRIDSFDAPLNSIHPGAKATLSWSTTDAVQVRLTGGGLDRDTTLDGELEVEPTETTRYELTASNAKGVEVKAEAWVMVLPKISAFTATPPRFDGRFGANVSLAWQVTGATDLAIESSAGAPVDTTGMDLASGEVAVHVTETTTFRLVATNSAGPVEASVTVTAVGPPTLQFTASLTQVGEGDEVTLAWATTDAETVELLAGGVPVLEGTVPENGEVTRSIGETTDFKLSATNEYGVKVEKVLTIEVGTVGISDVTVSKERVAAGQDVEIAWTAFGGTRVLVRGPDGVVPGCDFTTREDIVDGTCTVRPDSEGTFTYSVELSAGVTLLDTKDAIVVAREGAGILEFTATPSEIDDGGLVTITWQTEGDIDGAPPVLTLDDNGSPIDIADENPLVGVIGQTMTGPGTHILTLTATAPRGKPAKAEITIEVTPL